MIQVIFRPHLNLSIRIETMVSIREMEEVSAAKNTRRKKKEKLKKNCQLKMLRVEMRFHNYPYRP